MNKLFLLTKTKSGFESEAGSAVAPFQTNVIMPLLKGSGDFALIY